MRSFEERVQVALERAQTAQSEFWDAMLTLEVALGDVEIDSTRDLADVTAESLIEEFAPEAEADDIEHCDNCAERLEESQIGECDNCRKVEADA